MVKQSYFFLLFLSLFSPCLVAMKETHEASVESVEYDGQPEAPHIVLNVAIPQSVAVPESTPSWWSRHWGKLTLGSVGALGIAYVACRFSKGTFRVFAPFRWLLGVTGVHNEVAAARRDIQALRGTVDQMRTVVGDVREVVDGLSVDVAATKQTGVETQEQLRAHVAAIQERLQAASAEYNRLAGEQRVHADQLDVAQTKRMENLKTLMDDAQQKLMQLSAATEEKFTQLSVGADNLSRAFGARFDQFETRVTAGLVGLARLMCRLQSPAVNEGALTEFMQGASSLGVAPDGSSALVVARPSSSGL